METGSKKQQLIATTADQCFESTFNGISMRWTVLAYFSLARTKY